MPIRVALTSGVGATQMVRNGSTKGSKNFKGTFQGVPLKFLLPCADENLCEFTLSVAEGSPASAGENLCELVPSLSRGPAWD